MTQYPNSGILILKASVFPHMKHSYMTKACMPPYREEYHFSTAVAYLRCKMVINDRSRCALHCPPGGQCRAQRDRSLITILQRKYVFTKTKISRKLS